MELLNQETIRIGNDILLWITFIEIPAFMTVCLYIYKTTQRTQQGLEILQASVQNDMQKITERLSTYKLEVAHRYASISHLKDVEHRLTKYLFRIEKKLDMTGKSV